MAERGLDASSKTRGEMIAELRGFHLVGGRSSAEPASRPRGVGAAARPTKGEELEALERSHFSRVIYLGERARPATVVVLFHGLNDNAAAACEGLEPWTQELEGALLVVPQSPDLSEVWTRDPGDPGYDWLRQRGTHDTGDARANARELARVTRARLEKINAWLDCLLALHGLGNDRLILVGCSQGSILASTCGLQRGARGVVVLGGVPGQPVYSAARHDYVGGCGMNWLQLVSERPRRLPKVCLVNGTADRFVSLKRVKAMFSEFDCAWYIDEGAGHDFPWRWYWAALEWMRALLGGSGSTTARRRGARNVIRARRLPPDDAYGVK